MASALLYPFILVAGLLQALGNAMNALLRGRLVNPWLAATASFLPIVFVFAALFLALPVPLPTLDSLGRMPWYAAFGGVAGAVAVFGGLAFVDKVGSGPFNGLVITGNILTSLLLDSLGLFGLQGSGFKLLAWIGGALMVGGVVLIARSRAPNPSEGSPSDGVDTVHDTKSGGPTGPNGHAVRSGRTTDGPKEKEGGGGGLGKLLYPFILVAGALQALGVAWNAQLRGALVNPWLAAMVSFLPVVFVFATLFLVRPVPLPSRADLEGVRWWMPLAGIAGAVAVLAGLLFVDTVGAGAFNGLLITANLLTSIALDHFGLLGMKRVPAGRERLAGAGTMVVGIAMISVA